MLSNLGKALRNTFAGVVWRFAVFALAVAGFSGLMGLRQWHTHYAPSEVWAQEAAGKGLDWSPVVGAAATRMLPDGKAYDDKASFQRALLKEIRNPEVPLDLDAPEDRERLDGYREALARKKAILKEFHREIDPRDSVFARKTEMLSVVNAQIAEISAQLEQIRNDGAKPQEIKGQEKRLKDLLERRADLRMDIKEQSLERGTVETGFQKPLADLDARIRTAEDGIDAAFDAALSSARPIQGPVSNGILAPKLAIHIGDENNPLHILYILAWYGLEGLIVLLMCVVFVPPLLRFSGGASDPKTVQSNVTKRFRDWLGEAFGPRTVAGTARVAAVAAVTGLTALAAGDQPPIVPVVQHEESAVEFKAADRAPAVRVQDEGNPVPPELQDMLAQLAKQVDSQRRTIEKLETTLRGLPEETRETRQEVMLLTETTAALADNTRSLTGQMGNVAEGVSNLNASLGGLAFGHEMMRSSLDSANSRLSFIHGLAWTTAADVRQVKEGVEQARDVPAIAVDVLRMDGTPDGLMARVSPFACYQVTREVIGTIERATNHSDALPARSVLGALSKVEGKKMRVWKLRRSLRTYSRADANPAVHDLLQKLMPLILKTSRMG